MATIFAIQGWSQTTLSEGFESTTFPPDDWMIVNTLGPSTPWTRSTTYSNTGSACAYTTYNSSGAINYMITPKLVINSLTDSISFWARMSIFSSTFDQTFLKILVSTTDNNVTSFDTTTLLHISPSFTSTPNNQITDVYKKWTISLSDYIGQEIYIAFRQTDNNGYGLCIDDVSGPTLFVPTCPKPKNLTATNISTTSADIGWTPGSPTDMAWWIYYRSSGSSTWDSTYTTINPITLSNLNPNSIYEVQLRTDCYVEVSDLSSILQFKTACGAITSMPWGDSFDTYGTGTTIFPSCWTRNTTYADRPYVNSTSFSGAGSLYFYAGTAGTYNIAALPPIDQSIMLNTLRVNFKYRNTYATDTLKVGVMTDPNVASTWTQVGWVKAPTTATWGDYEVSLASYQGTGQYIALRADYSTTYTYAYVDDLVVSYIPLCAKPTNISASNITTTSADIAWTPGNSTDFAWWVYYSVAGSNVWDSVYATMNPYTITNLNPSSAYEVYLRTDCGVELSEPSKISVFYTACATITSVPWSESFDVYGTGTSTYPLPNCCTRINTYTASTMPFISATNYSPPGCLYFYTPTAGTYNIGVMPAFDTSIPVNTLMASFYYRNNSANDKLIIGVMSDPSNASTFDSITTITASANATWEFFEVSFGS